jgi:hypothetical protein
MRTLTWQEKYLRRQCGLPTKPPMRPDPDDPAARELTTAQAAEAAHVTENLVSQWAKRGLIVAVNDDPKHPRYLEIDVLTVEARTRRGARQAHLVEQAAAELDE